MTHGHINFLSYCIDWSFTNEPASIQLVKNPGRSDVGGTD